MIQDKIYGNSLWLIADAGMLSSLGFVFWLINTRLFSTQEIGIASALLAAAELIAVISLLGFDVALIRYSRHQDIANSCLTLSGAAAALLGTFFVLFHRLIIPVSLSPGISVLFIIFVVLAVMFKLHSSVFTGVHMARMVFAKDLLFSLAKIALPFTLAALGAYAIFSSWLIALAIAWAVSTSLLPRGYRIEINLKKIRKFLGFSSANYTANVLLLAPELILPLMIAKSLGPESTAYFYISWMIAVFLFFIPSSISRMTLAQGGPKNLSKAVRFTFALLIPAVLLIAISGRWILLIFGEEYSFNGSLLLTLLAISSLPYAINILATTASNIRHDMQRVLLINSALAISVIALSSALTGYGLAAVGYAFLLAQSGVAVYSGLILWRSG